MEIREWTAIAFLTAMIAVPIALAMRQWRLGEFSVIQSVARLAASLLVRFLWRTRREGVFDLPPGVGAIIVCNHRSSVDPFFVQASVTRKIRWMVAKEFYEHPAFGWFLRICETIPVGRGGVDTAATKIALRTVSGGGVIGMLPEGRINMTKEILLPVRPGAALVALKARVPVIPCYIEGAPYNRVPWSPFFMTARCVVRFGPAIDLSDLYGREQEPGVCVEAIERCMRGVAALAGQPDFAVQAAGRKWKPTAEEIAANADAQDEDRRAAARGQ